MFRVAIVGADGIKDERYSILKCIKILENKAKENEGILLISTGEKFIKTFSERFHIDMQVCYADFKKYGKDALKMRNNELLNICDAFILFDDGKKDTRILYELAISRSIPVRFIKK